MRSLILQTATRLLVPLMLLFSIFLLLRGHNAPGGGFVGGLVAAAAVALYAIAEGVVAARQLLRLDPRSLIAAGLGVAALSSVLPLLGGKVFFTGLWLAASGNQPAVGTPLVFDVGVYLVVVGVTVTIIFSLAEE
jgi:multicomponent Na+:H+ antiporter subunit B